jgi:MoaA/NifB/PqqE/SkfB family radical SAM enzyme
MIQKPELSATEPNTYSNDFFARAYAPWLARHPEHGEAAFVLLRAMAAAAETRGARMREHGCDMPETLVVSLTSVCNRRCQFCGAADVISGPKTRLSRELLDRALGECETLGIRRIALIGGEPLLFAELEDLIEDNPEFFFSIYTNGVLLDAARLERLSRLANHILIVNVSATNQPERVTHVDRQALDVLELLQRRGMLFGYAATIHRNNRELFEQRETLQAIHAYEPRLAILFDYLPSYDRDADPLSLAAAERADLVTLARELAASQEMMFVCVPEDEDIMGGCGAAGRSFIHLGPDGSITPCPFVPYASHRFPDYSLLDAVRGDYFSELRRRSLDWEKLDGPCAYRSAAAELREISDRHGAQRYAERVVAGTRRSLPVVAVPRRAAG